MEQPSLRSSTPRGTECKLRRTEPALHETIQRFVESLCPDIRISQYADLNFTTKKLHNDTWYWLEPISGGRVGYLVFLPDQPAVWIDEQCKQSYRIQLRVSVSVYTQPSVFIASLNRTVGILRLEDAWHVSGVSQLEVPFTKRWQETLDMYTHKYKADTQLQQGLRIELAEFKPLSAIKSWSPMPAMLFAQGEVAPRRLRVQFTEENKKRDLPRVEPALAPFYSRETAKVAPKNNRASKPSNPSKQPEEIIARAVPHEEYPDTYNLWIGSEKKGFAAVQDIELSRKLRSSGKEVNVNVAWNSEFNMYEIISQV